MYRRSLIAVLSVLTLTGEAHAQLRNSQSASLLSPAARAEMAGERLSAGQSLLKQTLYAAGGALVGAGLGYFTSQLVYSDWEKTSDSSFLDQRRLYSFSGATVGALTGLLVGSSRGPGAGISAARPTNAEAEGVETISQQEIADIGAGTVYQVIQTLHPDWFIIRGSKSLFEQGQVIAGGDRAAATIPGMPQIRTYLDRAQLGGVDDLHRIPAAGVQSIIRLSPSQATLRIGPDHPHGAIVVSMQPEG